MSDEDGVKTICNNVRKPAGTQDQPGWIAPAPNPNNITAPQVPRPGHSVPSLCEQRLKIAAYGAKIYEQIGREVTPIALNRIRLREFKNHQEMIANHSDPDPLPDLSKSFTIQKFLDQLLFTGTIGN